MFCTYSKNIYTDTHVAERADGHTQKGVNALEVKYILWSQMGLNLYSCVSFCPTLSLTQKHTYSRENLCSLMNPNDMDCYSAVTTDIIVAMWWDLYLLASLIGHTQNFLRDSVCFSVHRSIYDYSLYLVVYSLYFSLISSNFQLVTSLIYMYI